MSAVSNGIRNVDTIFEEIGEFGRFQIVSILLICIPSLLSASYVVNYIIATNTLDYRCKVPSCDNGENNREISYDQPWLINAIPSSKNGFESCVYYAQNESFSKNTSQCSSDFFNRSNEIKCTEFIYKTDEINVQTEFNIHCENTYMLALIGSANCLGRLIFLPITGMISDKYGRLLIICYGLLLNSVFGLIKTFSTNYWMYIVLEFLEASSGTCTFGAIYILGLEWMSSKYRAIGTTFIVTSFPIGEMLLGVVAMYIHNFRYLLRIMYTPGLFVIFYIWLVPESPRWLLSTGRVDRAIKVLKQIAAFNGKTLSESSIDMLLEQHTSEEINKIENNEKLSIFQQLQLIIASKKLGLRLLNCCYQWVTCCFCYYGLSLISTHIPGENRYMSFIMVQAVEIPGALLPGLLLNRYGRVKLMFASLTLSGISAFIAPWIPADKSIYVLLLFMVGKASITFALNILYIFTAELWPTNIRTTIMNLCSMTGRIGAIFAPLTALLISSSPFLPFLLFGSTALFAGALVLLCPDTFSKQLPNSVQEAKDL